MKLHPVVHGSPLVRSLKVYGVMFIFFASVSAVYMTHYNHPSDFYIYKILDGLMIFTLLAFANARIYPHVFRETSPRPGHGLHRAPYPPHSAATPQGSPDSAHHLHRPEPSLR